MKLKSNFILVITILVLSNFSFSNGAVNDNHELIFLSEDSFISSSTDPYPQSSATCFKDEATDSDNCQTFNNYLGSYLFVLNETDQSYIPNPYLIESVSHKINLNNFELDIKFNSGIYWSDGTSFHAVNDVLNGWFNLLDSNNGGDLRFIPILEGYFTSGGNALFDSLSYNLAGTSNALGFRLKIPLAITYDENTEIYSTNELKYSIYKDLSLLPILPNHVSEEQEDSGDIDFTDYLYSYTSLSPYVIDSYSATSGDNELELIRNRYSTDIYENVTFDKVSFYEKSYTEAIDILEEGHTDKFYILSENYDLRNTSIYAGYTNYEVQNLNKHFTGGFTELYNGHIRNHIIDNFNYYTHDVELHNNSFIELFTKAIDLAINKSLLVEVANENTESKNYHYKPFSSYFNIETDTFYNESIPVNDYNITKAKEIMESIGFDYTALEESGDEEFGNLANLLFNDYFEDDLAIADSFIAQLQENIGVGFIQATGASNVDNHTPKWDYLETASNFNSNLGNFFFFSINTFRSKTYNYFKLTNFYNPPTVDDNPFFNNIFNEDLKSGYVNLTAKDNYINSNYNLSKKTMIDIDSKHRQNLALITNVNNIVIDDRLTNYNHRLLAMNVINYEINTNSTASAGAGAGNGGGGGGGGGGGSSGTGGSAGNIIFVGFLLGSGFGLYYLITVFRNRL